MAKTVYLQNGNLVKLEGLIDLSNSSYVTNATVLAILKTGSGTNGSGQSWPLIMSHQISGTYQGVLESDLDLVGTYYNLEISVNSGSTSQGFFDFDVRGLRRK